MTRRPLRYGLPKLLGIVSSELRETFGPELQTYVSTIRTLGLQSGPKVINDPVWRTVRVEAWELAVVDSPLFQRLRHIHQLGLAGYVFPGANYSRFEHCIGVLHQVNRLIEAINRNGKAYAARRNLPLLMRVAAHDEVLLRLSGLVHDIGHGFLSHVSERVMTRFASVGDAGSVPEMRLEAQSFFTCPNAPAVAEILSALLILLPEFVDILECADVPYWKGKCEELTFRMAQLIAGGREPTRPFLTEIISGALDADKLDYMPRDCYMAGLPMPIDVDRLLEKIQVVSVPASRLPPGYAKTYNLSNDDTVEVLAVQAGGARAFEELVVSRVLLYDKLYNHQKVRAIEGMIENALDMLMPDEPRFRQFSTYLSLTDSQFLSQSWNSTQPKSKSYAAACELIRLTDLRQTFVRAFAFGPGSISDPDPLDRNNDEAIRANWQVIKPLVTRARTAAAIAFRAEVVKCAQKYLSLMGQAGLAKELSDHHVVIDLPDVQGIAEKTRFYVGDEDYGVDLYYRKFRVDRWAEAYENQKIVGYVFSPPEFSVVIYLAVRQCIFERAALLFESQSWAMTKLSPLKIADAAQLLLGRGERLQPFSVPADLESRRAYLTSVSRKRTLLQNYDAAIAELVRRFQTYQPAAGDTISERHIREWLLQFQFDDIPLCVTLLQNIRYWDRAALTDAFISAVQADNALKNSQWLALGGPTTSSRHLTYLWPEVKKALGTSVGMNVLSDAREISPDGQLVFYDDNVGSGGQGRTVLQQWFGVPDTEWIVNEEHVQKLLPPVIANLQSCRIDFLFVTGRREGLKRLIETAKQLCGHDRVGGHIVVPDDVDCFRPASRVFADVSSAARARDAFKAAGASSSF